MSPAPSWLSELTPLTPGTTLVCLASGGWHTLRASLHKAHHFSAVFQLFCLFWKRKANQNSVVTWHYVWSGCPVEEELPLSCHFSCCLNPFPVVNTLFLSGAWPHRESHHINVSPGRSCLDSILFTCSESRPDANCTYLVSRVLVHNGLFLQLAACSFLLWQIVWFLTSSPYPLFIASISVEY